MVCNMRRTSSSRRIDRPATPVGITSGASVAIVKAVDALAAAAEEEEEEDDEDEESALVESEVASVPHCGEAPAPDAVDWCSLAECCCCAVAATAAAAAVAASVAAGECRRERLVGRELRLMSEAQPCSLEISTTPTGRALLSPRRRGMVTWVDTGDRQPPNSHPPCWFFLYVLVVATMVGVVLARGREMKNKAHNPATKVVTHLQ